MLTLVEQYLELYQPFLTNGIERDSFYVYVILEKSRVCYIGKGINQRVKNHFNISSSAVSLAISRNSNDFDWKIIKYFDDDELGCLEFEKQLITDCKKKKHFLYNVANYNYNSNISQICLRGFLQIFKQWENRIFPYSFGNNCLTLDELAQIIFYLIKKEISKLSDNSIPSYRGTKINKLGYYLTKENEKYRVNLTYAAA